MLGAGAAMPGSVEEEEEEEEKPTATCVSVGHGDAGTRPGLCWLVMVPH